MKLPVKSVVQLQAQVDTLLIVTNLPIVLFQFEEPEFSPFGIYHVVDLLLIDEHLPLC